MDNKGRIRTSDQKRHLVRFVGSYVKNKLAIWRQTIKKMSVEELIIEIKQVRQSSRTWTKKSVEAPLQRGTDAFSCLSEEESIGKSCKANAYCTKRRDESSEDGVEGQLLRWEVGRGVCDFHLHLLVL